jgi:hypothetical protein
MGKTAWNSIYREEPSGGLSRFSPTTARTPCVAWSRWSANMGLPTLALCKVGHCPTLLENVVARNYHYAFCLHSDKGLFHVAGSKVYASAGVFDDMGLKAQIGGFLGLRIARWQFRTALAEMFGKKEALVRDSQKTNVY